MRFRLFFICVIASLLLACRAQPLKTMPPYSTTAPVILSKPTPVPDITVKTEPIIAPLNTQFITQSKPFDGSLLKLTSFKNVPAWQQDNLNAAWPAWLLGCQTLQYQSAWARVCSKAFALNQPDTPTVTQYFQANFNVYQTNNVDGTQTGLITGYYEPLLRGSRTKTAQYNIPLYKKPLDLLAVDDPAQPANKRLRGRLENGRMANYYTRAEIEATPSPLTGQELLGRRRC